MLWIINWLGESSSQTTRDVLNYLSITEHFDDFARHHRHEARGVLPQLHHVWIVLDGQVG
jgi:hypothetical protein